MRRVVHDTMLYPALYLARRESEPVRCNVRRNVRPAEAKPAGQNAAAVADVTPRLKFDRAEIPRPLNAAFVVLSETEAYKISRARPPEDEWVVAEVSQMSEAEAAALWDDAWAELLA